jgi:sugar/nucleoside kinase (ribokinase family)
MFDVITIGAAVRDVFLLSKEFQMIRSEAFSTGMGECVSLGAKIEVEDCVLGTGGGATNAAVTFANLGFQTSTVARIGNDELGRDIVADLTKYKVDTSLIKSVKKGATGYSTLLTASSGERTALVYRGVSGDFTNADLPKVFSAKWLYITSLSGNLEVLSKIISTAKKAGVKIAVNPGGNELHKTSQLRPILNGVDVLLVNLEEAQILTGLGTKDGKILSSKLAVGETIAVVTDGARGAYAAFGKEKFYAKNRNTKSISRTGAGDAFGSGFVASLMKGYSLEDALKIATLNAENVIQHIGAKKGILTKWPKGKDLEEIRVYVTK